MLLFVPMIGELFLLRHDSFSLVTTCLILTTGQHEEEDEFTRDIFQTDMHTVHDMDDIFLIQFE